MTVKGLLLLLFAATPLAFGGKLFLIMISALHSDTGMNNIGG